jgi:Protein of unknown function (DUF2752)
VKPRILRGAAAALLFAVLWLVSLPAEPRFSVCGFHWLTGLPCPLCGLTRGLFSLAKGRWHDAVAFNALTPLGFAMLFSLCWEFRWRGRLWGGGAAAFAAYGVVRILLAGK